MLGNNSYVTIILTKRCSLKCDYCFEDAGPSGKEDWDVDTVESCLAEARSVGYKWVAITCGDPLTHPQFDDILSVVERSGLKLFLETNGMLITDALADRLARFYASKDLRIQISLDSEAPARHDRWRGQGAHAAAVKAIDKFVSRKLPVQVCKVIVPEDFTGAGFNLDSYIEFCRALGVVRVEVTRSVPMGRGEPAEFRMSQDQLRQARTYLETRPDFGLSGFILSTHFNHVNAVTSIESGPRSLDAGQCRRLSGSDPGIVANTDSTDKGNWKFSPCSFLQDIEIGQAGDLRHVVEGLIQKRMAGLRVAAMVGFEAETVWGCTECRPRFLKVLNEWQSLRLYDSALAYREPAESVPKTGVVR